MKSTKLTVLATGETISTLDEVCLVDLQKALDAVEGEYHVLQLDREGLSALADATCPQEVAERLTSALGEQQSIRVGYCTFDDEAKWCITGRARDRQDKPITGLRVLAYDKDTVKQDDFLGCAFSDSDGSFEISYAASDFKSEKAFIDLEGNPDIYLVVTDVDSGASKKTVTLGEADQEEHFELKLDLSSATKTLRPIVGYYFIEEDRLNEEVEELTEAIARDPEDTQAHFLLALCNIELMKADLSRAEWINADIRSADDVLAISANNELDIVASQDPDRADEVARYREYVQKLQDLAF